MIIIIIVFAALLIIYKFISEKLTIKFSTFLRKGFKLNKGDKKWGVYTFTRQTTVTEKRIRA